MITLARALCVVLFLLGFAPEDHPGYSHDWFKVTIRFSGRWAGGYGNVPPKYLAAPPVERWVRLQYEYPSNYTGALVALQADGTWEETGQLHQLSFLDDRFRNLAFGSLSLRTELFGETAAGDGLGGLTVRMTGRARGKFDGYDTTHSVMRSTRSVATFTHITDTSPAYSYRGRARVTLKFVPDEQLPFDPAEVQPDSWTSIPAPMADPAASRAASASADGPSPSGR
jgi:hypothetical protein